MEHNVAWSAGLVSVVVVLLSTLLLYFRSKSSLVSKDSSAGGKAIQVTATGAAAEDKSDTRPRCTLLYGTQTGTAERFAKDLRMQLTQRYGDSMVFDTADLEDYDASQRLPSEKLVFFLVATYGDGEPTDNAATFYDWLIGAASEAASEGLAPLEGVHYGVFGLGNKQYEHFCAVGKHVFKAIAALGATPVAPRGDGDDDDDIDADFETWCGELFKALDKSDLVQKQSVVAKVSVADLPSYEVQALPPGTTEAPPQAPGTGADHNSLFPARVLVVRELHSPESDRSCVHVELDVTGSAIRYQAGDHVAVYAENKPAVVAAAAQLLGVDPSTIIQLSLPPGNPGQLSPPFPGPVSIGTALARHTDLLGPVHKQQLGALAAFATNPAERERLQRMASPDGKENFHTYVVEGHRCLLDVLADFPSARPPLGPFFGCIAGRLQPRFYSISSSPLAHPQSVHITCAVVSERTPAGRHHEGVASTWLAQLRPGDTVEVYTRHSTFKLPPHPAVPVVMVGPGTGLAPFRAFLQERTMLAAQGAHLGPAFLYFGCRNRRHDYIYEEELAAWAGTSPSTGVLTALYTAFSREGATKNYVQHHITRNAAELWQALGPQGGGYLYVCGDAKHMARDVHRALHDALVQATGCSGHEAEAAVKQLADSGRYHKDVW